MNCRQKQSEQKEITVSNEKSSEYLIKVVGSNDPPYRIIKDNNFSGIYFDIIKIIGKNLDLEIKFIECPFKRALQLLESGAADIMIGPTYSKERQEYMVYSTETLPSECKVFYIKQEANDIEKYEDLKGKTIAVHYGKVYFDRFDKDITLRKEYVTNYKSAFEKVVNKRNDMVIIPEREGNYLVNKYNYNLKKAAYRIRGKPVYITVSKKSIFVKLLPKISTELRKLKENGIIDKIFSDYNKME